MKTKLLIFMLFFSNVIIAQPKWPSPTFINLTTKGDVVHTRTKGLYSFSLLNYDKLSGGQITNGDRILSYGAAFTNMDTACGFSFADSTGLSISMRIVAGAKTAGINYNRYDATSNELLMYYDSLHLRINSIPVFSAYNDGSFIFYNNLKITGKVETLRVDSIILGNDTLTAVIPAGNLSSTDLGSAANPLYTIFAQQLSLEEGSNAAMGVDTLASGTITINTTRVTANSRIFFTLQNCSNCGYIYVSARTAGTSFTVTSSNNSDASTIAWMIIEPN